MAGNTFGKQFKVTTFGESHGMALGCVIDGCPAGVTINESQLQHALDRRKPGAKNNVAVTARSESDRAENSQGLRRQSRVFGPREEVPRDYLIHFRSELKGLSLTVLFLSSAECVAYKVNCRRKCRGSGPATLFVPLRGI